MDFEQVRNTLQMIIEMLNRLPLEHGRKDDVFKVTAEKMDNFLASVTPDMSGDQVVEKGKEILKDCESSLQKMAELSADQAALLKEIQKLDH